MEKDFLSPSLGLGPFLFPPPTACLPPFPFLPCIGPVPGFSPPRGPGGQPAPRASSPLLVSAADRASPLSASLPGGTHLSGSSSTSSPARTRVRAQQPRAFHASYPLYILTPMPRNPQTRPEHQPPRPSSPKSPPRSATSPIRRCSAFEPPRATCRASFSSCEVADTLLSRFTVLYPLLTLAELVPGPPSADRRREP